MPRSRASIWAAGLLLVFPAAAAGQPDLTPPAAQPVAPPPPAGAAASDAPTTAGAGALPPSLIHAIEALGASSGVPDGLGAAVYPNLPVLGQNARLGLWNYQAGITAPVYTTATDGLFANGSLRTLGVQTNAVLPVHRDRFPSQFWDVQIGGAYVRQLEAGWSWGVWANVGSASDQPFHSIREDTLSALAFLRIPQSDQTGWLYYVVSTTNGQIGHNIPIPGLAYEFRSDKFSGVVGFPFVTLNYKPDRLVECDFYYAALTDVQAKLTLHPVDPARVYAGFEWTNQSWFRADREFRGNQLFLYEKRLFGGVGWASGSRIDFRLTGGYAFDRYFVENSGFSISGKNRIDIGPGPFIAGQLELKF